jgi:hypothetical protein
VATVPRLPIDEGIGPVQGADMFEDPVKLKEERQPQEQD